MKVLGAILVVLVALPSWAKLSDGENQAVKNTLCGEVVKAKVNQPLKPGSALDELGDAEVDMLKEEIGDDCTASLKKFKAKNKVALAYKEVGGSIIFCGLTTCFVVQTLN